MSRWPPIDEAEFDRVCARCSKRVRRQFGNWQGYDGLFICFDGEVPGRADLDRRHVPSQD